MIISEAMDVMSDKCVTKLPTNLADVPISFKYRSAPFGIFVTLAQFGILGCDTTFPSVVVSTARCIAPRAFTDAFKLFFSIHSGLALVPRLCAFGELTRIRASRERSTLQGYILSALQLGRNLRTQVRAFLPLPILDTPSLTHPGRIVVAAAEAFRVFGQWVVASWQIASFRHFNLQKRSLHRAAVVVQATRDLTHRRLEKRNPLFTYGCLNTYSIP